MIVTDEELADGERLLNKFDDEVAKIPGPDLHDAYGVGSDVDAWFSFYGRRLLATIRIERTRFNTLAMELSGAWLYGGWVAQTAAEREMERVMTEAGWWPITEDERIRRRATSTQQPPSRDKPIVCGVCDATLTSERGCAHFMPLGQGPEQEIINYRRALAEIAALGGPGWEIAERALAENRVRV